MKLHKWREFSLEEILIIAMLGFIWGSLATIYQLSLWGLI